MRCSSDLTILTELSEQRKGEHIFTFTGHNLPVKVFLGNFNNVYLINYVTRNFLSFIFPEIGDTIVLVDPGNCYFLMQNSTNGTILYNMKI